MDDTTRDLLRRVMEKFNDLSYIDPEDVPDIPLYMDQITTFMDSRFAACKRYPDDKVLTKTMINNYTKNKLIPPPDKKKYSKEHLLLLIYVYYLKDFLSISDIKTLLDPLEERHFGQDDGLTMQEIYEGAFRLVRSQTSYMTRDLIRRWKASSNAFVSSPGEEGREDEEEYLQIFAFVCLLSFDVYVKKKLIETMVDALNEQKNGAARESKETKEGKTGKN